MCKGMFSFRAYDGNLAELKMLWRKEFEGKKTREEFFKDPRVRGFLKKWFKNIGFSSQWTIKYFANFSTFSLLGQDPPPCFGIGEGYNWCKGCEFDDDCRG